MERQKERQLMTQQLNKRETFTKICSEYSVDRNAEVAMTMEGLRNSLVPVDPATLLTNQAETLEKLQPKKRVRKPRDTSKKITRKPKDPNKRRKDTDHERKKRKSENVIAWEEECYSNVPLVLGLDLGVVDVEVDAGNLFVATEAVPAIVAPSKSSERSIDDEIISAIISGPLLANLTESGLVDSTSKQESDEALGKKEETVGQVQNMVVETSMFEDCQVDSVVPDPVWSEDKELVALVPTMSYSTLYVATSYVPLDRPLLECSTSECHPGSPDSDSGNISPAEAASVAESEDLGCALTSESVETSGGKSEVCEQRGTQILHRIYYSTAHRGRRNFTS